MSGTRTGRPTSTGTGVSRHRSRLPRRAAAAVLAVAVGFGLAACSGSAGSLPSAVPPSLGTGASVSDGGSTAPSAGAVLTVADIGEGFQQIPLPASNVTDTINGTLPCSQYQPSVDRQVPPASVDSVAFAKPDGSATIVERVLRYRQLGTTTRARSVAEAGLECRSATVADQAVLIQGPQDMRSRLTEHGLDAAESWSLTYPTEGSAITVIQTGEILLLFQFTADNDAAPGVIAQDVIEKALRKQLGG